MAESIVAYRRYGPRLGLKDADIENIELDRRVSHSVKLITAAMFKEWHTRMRSDATYGFLVETALSLEDGTGAEEICSLCAKSSFSYTLYSYLKT